VLHDILSWSEDRELAVTGLIRSPIEGSGGNVEFLMWLQPGQEANLDPVQAIQSVT
jgi:predicted rRNA methylase YqxC with S4 and FtsJ domains